MAEGESPTRRPYTMVVGDRNATGNKPPTHYIEALINLVKGYVGTGIFAMAQAFKNGGLILGPVLLVITALINLHCQHLLIKASVKVSATETVEVRPSFSETVKYTMEDSSGWMKRYCRAFAIITDVFLCIAQVGFCCVYLVFVSNHFAEIALDNGWRSVNIYIMLAIIIWPIWATTFINNMKWLMPVSLLANILMWAGVVMIFYYTLKEPADIKERNLVASYDRIPLFFGVVLFSFEAITFILPVRNEMKKPEQFVSPFGVLNVGLVIILALYLSVGFVGYWKYGEKVEGSVFLNMPHKEILSHATKGLIAFAVAFSYPFQMYIPFEIMYPLFHARFGPFKCPTLMRLVFKSLLVILTYLIANAIPKLGLFISLVGAFTGAVLAMILPPLLDLAMHKGDLKALKIIKNSVIIILGFVALITGTILSVYDIVIEFTSSKKK